jgi:hypothetical protein
MWKLYGVLAPSLALFVLDTMDSFTLKQGMYSKFETQVASK